MQTRRSYRVVHPYGLPSDISFSTRGSLEEQMGDLSIATAEDRSALLSILKQSFLFIGVSDAILNEVAEAMYRKRVYDGDVVVTQNDKYSLRALYAVQSGTLTGRDNVAWVENEGDENAEKKEAVKVRTYGKGGDRMCFNEQCMAHAQNPHETVTANSDVVLWVLDFATYTRLMREDDEPSVNMLTSALRGVDALKAVSISDLRRIATNIVDKRGKSLVEGSNKRAHRASRDSRLNAMYIISRGDVSCTVRANARDESETPRVVLKLTSGQYFGERALLSRSGAPCATNIQAISDDVEVWRVKLTDITNVTGTERSCGRRAHSRAFVVDGRIRSPSARFRSARAAVKFRGRRASSREALYMTLLGHLRETKGASKEATVQISLARTESLARVEGVLRERAIITMLTAAQPSRRHSFPYPPSHRKTRVLSPFRTHFAPRCALEAVIACGGGSKPEVVQVLRRRVYARVRVRPRHGHRIPRMDPETMTIDQHGALRLTDFRFAKHLAVTDATPGRRLRRAAPRRTWRPKSSAASATTNARTGFRSDVHRALAQRDATVRDESHAQDVRVNLSVRFIHDLPRRRRSQSRRLGSRAPRRRPESPHARRRIGQASPRCSATSIGITWRTNDRRRKWKSSRARRIAAAACRRFATRRSRAPCTPPGAIPTWL